ncbi:hypothetical protein GCM10009105_10240 [Dokdonella soli]|uniref:Uncharacterized protein n=1 Tax=Dokdonella soli TaxID=529810 RepID=A0ABN1IDZ4_9GAMM
MSTRAVVPATPSPFTCRPAPRASHRNSRSTTTSAAATGHLVLAGRSASVREIAKAENLDERYVARILYSSLLAPDIVEKIVQGRQPVRFTVKSLKWSPPLDS